MQALTLHEQAHKRLLHVPTHLVALDEVLRYSRGLILAQ